MKRRRRFLRRVIGWSMLIDGIAIATFLVIVVPVLSPRFRSAVLQYELPRGPFVSRTFDLCTYENVVYVGTCMREEGVGDPFEDRRRRLVPRAPSFAARCNDFCFTYGAEYSDLIDRGGTRALGIGFARIESRRQSAWVVSVSAWYVIALSLAAAALPVAIWLRGRTRSPGACANCGYDLRATPERCPECGAVPGTAAAGVQCPA